MDPLGIEQKIEAGLAGAEQRVLDFVKDRFWRAQLRIALGELAEIPSNASGPFAGWLVELDKK
jgi:hypothetical protein